ncbi:hypothetical protein [Phormidesmis priestleyi]
MQLTQTNPSAAPNLSAGASLHKVFAYSMDALIPGLYFWCGFIKLRIGGSPAELTYPGTLHSRIGIALVLANYRIHSTYRGSYDPR